MKKYKQILIVLILSFFLRFFLLGNVPENISSDEAALGYNAFSILKTGKDEFGEKLPLAFRSFGEFKAPLYIYFSVPFIFLLGLNELSIRLPSALLGTFAVLGIYLTVNHLFKNKKLALTSAFIMSIIPWDLQFTRIAYEGSLSLFLIIYGLYFYNLGVEKKNYYLLLSFIFFALSLYSHYSERIFIFLFIPSLILLNLKSLIKIKRLFISAVVLFVLIVLPLIPYVFSTEGTQRASFISFTTDKGITVVINEKRAEHNWATYKIPVNPSFIHNKASEYLKRFSENYLAHFDFSFLLFKGDEDNIFRTPYIGLIFVIFVPFIFIGLIDLLKNNADKRIIITWLILSPIASALTRLGPSANRAFLMVVPLSVFISYGYTVSLDKFFQSHRFIHAIIILIFITEAFFYLDSYYFHFSFKNAGDNRVGSKEVITTADSLKDNYDEVWVTNKSGGYIHFLFYLHYPPADYQRQSKISPLNEYGFGEVQGFDKYVFSKIPKYYDFSKSILYIAKDNEWPKDVMPITKFYYSDGRESYYIYDTNNLIQYCIECNLNLKPVDENIYGEKIKI